MVFNHKIINDKDAYGWGPVLLHWLVALAIFGLYALGLYMEDLDYYDDGYHTLPEWHKAVGILVALLLALRLVWRILNPPPELLSQPPWQAFIAKWAHRTLYLLLGLTLLSGYLMSTADGHPIAPFNWFSIPALPISIDKQEDIAGELHELFADLMIILSMIHALAAFKHHFFNKDATLKRIFALREKHNE